MTENNFIKNLEEIKFKTWERFECACEAFLVNKRSQDFINGKKVFQSLFATVECRMSMKIHSFIHISIFFFFFFCGVVSNEESGRFHQDIATILRIWNKGFLTDYCSILHKHEPENKHLKIFSQRFNRNYSFILQTRVLTLQNKWSGNRHILSFYTL